jgi:hypothetical protein
MSDFCYQIRMGCQRGEGKTFEEKDEEEPTPGFGRVMTA